MQRIFIVDIYKSVTTKSYKNIAENLESGFPIFQSLWNEQVYQLVYKFQKTGFLLKKKRKKREQIWRVLSEEALQDNEARLESSSRKSSRRLSEETGVPVFCTRSHGHKIASF
jgi:hypothetical protein